MKRLLIPAMIFGLASTALADTASFYKDTAVIEKPFSNTVSVTIPAAAYDLKWQPEAPRLAQTITTNIYPPAIALRVEEYISLTNARHKITRELQAGQDEKKRIITQNTLLEKMLVAISANTNPKFQDSLDKYIEKIALNHALLDTLDKKDKQLTEELKKLQEQIQPLENLLNSSRISLQKISFVSPKSGLLTYRIASGWQPSYQVNLDTKQFDMKIAIRPGANVLLPLENTTIYSYFYQPAQMDTKLPRLVGTLQPVYQYNQNMMYKNKSAMPAPQAQMEARGAARLEAEEALMNSQALNYTEDTSSVGISWNIGGQFTLENNAELTVASAKPLAINQTYFALPVKSGWGYAVLELSNTSDTTMLPGAVTLSTRGQTIPDLFLSTAVAPQSAYTFPGIETRNIQCERRITADYSESPNLIRNTWLRKKTIEIKVKNQFPRPLELTLLDRLAISSDSRLIYSDIKVTGKTETQIRQTIASNNGILDWKLTLQPAESRTFSISYTTEYPKDFTVAEREQP